MGSFFLNLNRNKRSVVLDLKRGEAREAMLRLLATTDVLVHNMRESAVQKLGLGYDALSKQFPRLIHAAAKGFAEGGPYSQRPAYDDVIQGLSAVTGLNARATGMPGYAPMLLTDKLCGIYLSSAIAMALVNRARTGKGQAVTVPMFETMASFNLLEHMADAVLAPSGDEPSAPLGYARVFGAQHRPLATADGHICLIANTDAQWQRLFGLLECPDHAGDPRFHTIGTRMANVEALYAIVEQRLQRRTTAEWLEALAKADIPAGPANELEDLRQDPHLRQQGFFQTFVDPVEGAMLMPGVPFGFSDTPGRIRRGPPRLGEHTSEVLSSLGYSDSDIARIQGTP